MTRFWASIIPSDRSLSYTWHCATTLTFSRQIRNPSRKWYSSCVQRECNSAGDILASSSPKEGAESLITFCIDKSITNTDLFLRCVVLASATSTGDCFGVYLTWPRLCGTTIAPAGVAFRLRLLGCLLLVPSELFINLASSIQGSSAFEEVDSITTCL